MAYTTIDDPSAHFQTLLYSGNASDSRALTNDGNSDLQPDLVWIKERSSTSVHQLIDSTRGGGLALSSNDTGADESFAYIDTFDTDGFTLETSDGSTNASGETYVGWQWKANGGTRTTNTESGNNPAGGYQVNTTAGFSIVDYTGTGAAGTMAHGLGAVPHLMIVRNREISASWLVYHHKNTAAPATDILQLDSTAATYDGSGYWNDTAPTSSVFTINDSNDANKDADGHIAYIWTEIQGYSKFGSYTGNGNADGPFIYLGFKPAMLIYKRTDSTANWSIFDNKRSVYNQISHQLNPNISNAEGDSDRGDFVSNGWKIRATAGSTNADGGTYIFMAFAEHPFVSSEGVPCTAR